jgi:autotransporter passenger strand-loop-strand repeat protein
MPATIYVKPENSPVTDLTLKTDEEMLIESGGTASNTTIEHRASATINHGGLADKTAVQQDGVFIVSGGKATRVTVEGGGSLQTTKGSIVTNIVADKGAILALTVAPDTQAVGTSNSVAFQIENASATGFELEKGTLSVSSGGTAIKTVLNTSGALDVYHGGKAVSATVNANGELKVLSGGTATETAVNAGGILVVHSCGLAETAVVAQGANLEVTSSGGLATWAKVSGQLTVSDGGKATGATVFAGAVLKVAERGIAEGADVDGFLDVLEGGLASNITLKKGANGSIQSHGIGSDIVVEDGAVFEVLSAGRLKGATVYKGGTATIQADVTASNVVIDGGKVTIMKDGTAAQSGVSGNTIVTNGGLLEVQGSAKVNGAYVSDGGHVNVLSEGSFASALIDNADVSAYKGAIVSHIDMKNGGTLRIESGASVKHLNVSEGGILTGILHEVSEISFYGGTVDLDISKAAPGNDFIIDDYSFSNFKTTEVNTYLCTLTVAGTQADGSYKLIEAAGGFDKTITVQDTTGKSLGTISVGGGETTIGSKKYTLAIDAAGLNLTIAAAAGNSGDDDVDYTGDLTTYLEVNDGQVASGMHVYTNNGDLVISSGGKTIDTTVDNHGSVQACGGLAADTTVNNGGNLTVEDGSLVSQITVNSGGLVIVSGGTATQITENGGYVSVFDGTVDFLSHSFSKYVFDSQKCSLRSGTTGTKLDVYNNARLDVFNGGVVADLTIADLGMLFVHEGGKITGKLKLESEGGISGEIGAIFDFDLTKTTPDADALVNDLSFARFNQFSYTLTVDGTQADGIYKLAEGATGFVEDITVQDTAGKSLGTISVGGGRRTIGSQQYTLTIDDAAGLNLTIAAAGGDDVDLTGDVTNTVDLTDGMVASAVSVYTEDGILNISSGALASNTSAAQAGQVNVFQSGKAIDFKLESDGQLNVSSGGVAGTVEINVGGVFTLNEHAGASGVTVHSGGCFNADANSFALVILADEGAKLDLTVAPNTSAIGQYAGSAFEIGATAADYTIHSGGCLNVENGGVAGNTTVKAGGSMCVGNGGLASDTAIEDSGALHVSDGGLASNTTVQALAQVHVSKGGFAGGITLNPQGSLHISNGGWGSATTVSSGGELDILSGGFAADFKITSGGLLSVANGGKVTGKMSFDDGATVSAETGALFDFDLTKTTPDADALVNDLSFAMANPFSYTLTVSDSEAVGAYKLAGNAADFGDKTITVKNTLGETLGTLTVAGGETTIGSQKYTLTLSTFGILSLKVHDDTPIDLTGDLTWDYQLTAGKFGSSVNILNDGRLYVENGGMTSETTVNKYGVMVISSGGSADVINVNGGDFILYSYANATGVDIASEGFVTVFYGASMTGVTVRSASEIDVYDGGIVNEVVAEKGAILSYWIAPNTHITGKWAYEADPYEITDTATGFTIPLSCALIVCDGGQAIDTTVSSDGQLILSGGVASNTTVSSDGQLFLSGGVASSTTVKTGGIFTFCDSGTATGNMVFETGAILNFNISAVDPDNAAFMNDLSIITGTPDYTLVVDNDDEDGDAPQELGDYKLAGGATGFDKTITVMDTDGVELGTLTVDGGATTLGCRTYTLSLTDGLLGVTVGEGGDSPPDTTAPTVTHIMADVTGPTNQNVTVTADFADDVALKSSLYKFEGDADWSAYPVGGVVVDRNTTVYFKAVDAAGNETTSSYAVTNITAAAPDLTGDLTSVFNLTDDMYASDVHVYSGQGVLNISSGALASNTLADSFGRVNIFQCGSAKGVSLGSFGLLNVSNGGMVEAVTVASGGQFTLFESAGASGIQIDSGGSFFASRGATVQDLTADEGAMIGFVVASDTLVSGTYAGSAFEFTSSLSGYTVHSGGTVYIEDGGSTGNTTVESGGSLFASAGVVDGVTVSSGGSFTVSNGAIATGRMRFEAGAYVYATDGAILGFDLMNATPGADALVNDFSFVMDKNFNFTLTVERNVAAGDYKLAENVTGFDKTITVMNTAGDMLGTLTVADGMQTLGDGREYTLTLTDGSLALTLGKVPDDITGDLTGECTLFSGMVGGGVNINEGGILNVLSGGLAEIITVNKDGVLKPFGGLASGVTVNDSGSVQISSGGTAVNIANSGHVVVFENGVASDTTVDSLANLTVSSGGTAVNTANSGHVVVFENGVASNTTVSSLADVTVSSGGTAAITTINDTANLTVCDGGTASGITVSSGGSLTVSSGGTATGNMTFEDGANITIVESAFIIFDISQLAPGADAPVNDLSYFTNTTTDYTVMVSKTQAAGDYKLAVNAADYHAVLGVVYPDGLLVGALSEFGAPTVLHDHRSYTMEWLDTGVLGITVGDFQLDTTPPTITVTPSTVEPDVVSVTVTAEFSDDVAVASSLYKLGESGEWQDYPDGGVVVTENTTVSFKATDTAGNETTASYVVSNIDNKHVDYTGDLTDKLEVKKGEVASGMHVHMICSELTVSSGGKVLDSVVDDVGVIDVIGGSASKITVSSNGELDVSSGGLASNTTVLCSAYFEVADDSYVDNTTVSSGGSFSIFDSSMASNTTVSSGGYFETNDDSYAAYTTIEDGGTACVCGGMLSLTTVNTGAYFEVNGKADNTTVNGYLLVCRDGLATNTTVCSGGCLEAGSKGMANTTTIEDGAVGSVSYLGSAYNTMVCSGGYFEVSGGMAADTTVSPGARFLLEQMGTATNTVVSSGAQLSVWGWQTLATSTTVNGTLVVEVYGCLADHTSVEDGGLFQVNSGGWITSTTVSKGGRFVICNPDGSATDTSVEDGGLFLVSSGGPAINTTVNSGGTLCIFDGGVANTTTVNGGQIQVSSGGTVDSTTVGNGGLLHVSSGGRATNTTVSNGGSFYLCDGATADNVTLGGGIEIENGGRITGKITFETGAAVTAHVGAKFDFDLTQTSTDADALVNDLSSALDQPFIFTLTVDGNVGAGSYKLAGNATGFDKTITVMNTDGDMLGTLTVDGGTKKLAGREYTLARNDEQLLGITLGEIVNELENDWLYNKKTKEWNTAEHIAAFTVNDVTVGDSMVIFDGKGSVKSEDGKYFNSVSRTRTEDGTVEDAADYAKIKLTKGAALTFSVDSTIGGTFYVYEAMTDKKGSLVPTQRLKIDVKAGKVSKAKNATVYLAAGEYFVGMEAKLPSAKKNPEVTAYYNVNLTGTKFFEDADDGWNNSAYALDANGKEDKTKLNAALVSGASDFGRGATAIEPDTGKEWVGFGDAADYKMIRLENAVNLTLNFTATGKAKLAIWKVSTGKGGKITLTSKGSATATADKAGTIKAKFLDAGEYFVSVTSTDAAKGGDAYYSIAVDPATVFFDSADNGKNDVLYNKKGKTFYAEDATHHFETTTVNGAGIHVKLDSDPVGDTDYENFVGYGDAADYAKIELASDGNLSFDLKATGNATFVVYKKGQDKKGNDTLVAIQTTKLTVAKDKDIVETSTDLLTGLTAGEYYVSMTAKSTKANASGSVFYSVTANLNPSVADALSMPETSGSLSLTDVRSFGEYDADALAGASAFDKLASFDDASSWQSIAKLA